VAGLPRSPRWWTVLNVRTFNRVRLPLRLNSTVVGPFSGLWLSTADGVKCVTQWLPATFTPSDYLFVVTCSCCAFYRCVTFPYTPIRQFHDIQFLLKLSWICATFEIDIHHTTGFRFAVFPPRLIQRSTPHSDDSYPPSKPTTVRPWAGRFCTFFFFFFFFFGRVKFPGRWWTVDGLIAGTLLPARTPHLPPHSRYTSWRTDEQQCDPFCCTS